MRRILTLIDYYLPGSKAGGPLRTIVNMVTQLSDEFEFWIITRDRDLGDRFSYPNVVPNTWVHVGPAFVYYCDKSDWTGTRLIKLINQTPHDVLYLNSFLSPRFTVIPLLHRVLGRLKSSPIIIAPRGEFSPGALKLSKFKKQIFFDAVRCLNLYRGLVWQASSFEEEQAIRLQSKRLYGAKNHELRVVVAPDLLPNDVQKNFSSKSSRNKGPLRIIFLSRISPMKNLDFLLRVLASVKPEIELSIFGPIEDLKYWEQCLALIDGIPPNIKVSVGEFVAHDRISETFRQFDLFAFPTRGENFGHVIFESLSAGTPVLLSDNTPWQQDPNGGLQIIPLSVQSWIKQIEYWAEMSHEQLLTSSKAAHAYAEKVLSNPTPIHKNKALFHQVLL